MNEGLDRRLMKIDFLIKRGQVYRLFTALFMHANLSHLVMNCFSINNIGPQAEKVFGQGRFFIFYLLSGVLANIGTLILGTSPYALGASGSAFGIVFSWILDFITAPFIYLL